MAKCIDLTGQKFGRLTVIRKGNGRKTSGGQYKTTWICVCDCGKKVEVESAKLRNGHTASCGCLLTENKGSHFDDLTGQRFGRLVVLRFIPKSERTARQYNWLCKCDCGNEVKASANKLKEGLQKSCGCLKEEMKPMLGELSRKYKHSNERLYRIYRAMLDRCYKETSREYGNYGGRGIVVCRDWLDSFDNFAEWALSTGYDQKAEQGVCTLDRIDTNGNYSPDNCRWVSNLEQQQTRRDCHRITFRGEEHTIAEWGRILDIPKCTLYQGLLKRGLTLEYYVTDYTPRKRR